MTLSGDNPDDLAGFIARFTRAACTGPGAKLAECFTDEGVYHDGFYGAFRGRDAIAAMIDDHFHAHSENLEWVYKDVCEGEGLAYGSYRFHYDSLLPGAKGTRVTMEGMGRFRFRKGLIADYSEIFDVGIGMTQLGFPAERIARSLQKRAAAVVNSPIL